LRKLDSISQRTYCVGTITNFIPVYLQTKAVVGITTNSLGVSTRLAIHSSNRSARIKLNFNAARVANEAADRTNPALKRPWSRVLKHRISARAATTARRRVAIRKGKRLKTLLPTNPGLPASLRKWLHDKFPLSALQKGLPQRCDRYLRPTELCPIRQRTNGMNPFAQLIPVKLHTEAVVRITTSALCISAWFAIDSLERPKPNHFDVDTARLTDPPAYQANAALKRPLLWSFK
jgi:hypothetical protein